MCAERCARGDCCWQAAPFSLWAQTMDRHTAETVLQAGTRGAVHSTGEAALLVGMCWVVHNELRVCERSSMMPGSLRVWRLALWRAPGVRASPTTYCNPPGRSSDSQPRLRRGP